MTKQQLLEFQWFAEGFYRATHRLAMENIVKATDTKSERMKALYARGAQAAATIVLGDIRRLRVTSHKPRVTKK